MKSRTLSIASLLLSVLVLSGCAPLIIGGAVGVLGGYAISKDTIQGEADKDYDLLWQAASTVASIKGKITTEDKTKGYLESRVNSSRVRIQIIRLTKATTQLSVSARKWGLPNISLAQEIFIKILEQAS